MYIIFQCLEVSMSEKKWKCFYVEGHRYVFSSPEVFKLIHTNFCDQKLEIKNLEEKMIGFVDNGGMCFIDRAYVLLNIDDLNVSIALEDCESFLRQAEKGIDSDKFKKRGWYNLYGRHQLLALSKDQYQELINVLSVKQKLIDNFLDSFYKYKNAK